MTAMLRMSPFVQGAFVHVDPDDARLLPCCPPALRAVVAAFEAVDAAGALEHRTRCEASDPIDGVLACPGDWLAVMGDIATALAACTAAFEQLSTSAAAEARRGFASKTRLVYSHTAVRQAAYQLNGLYRAVCVHRTNVWHVLEAEEQAAALYAIDQAVRLMAVYAPPT